MNKFKTITKEEFLKEDPSKKFQHPRALLSDLMEIIKNIGADKFLKGAGFNKERDALFGCMFSLAMRTFNGREFYLQQISDPPDFVMLAPTGRKEADKPFDFLNVEVVSVVQAVEGAENQANHIKDLIKRTKLNKSYEKGTILLIAIKVASVVNIPLLQSWVVSGELSNFGEVFLLNFKKDWVLDKTLPYEINNLSKGWKRTFSLIEEFNKPIMQHPLMEKYGAIVK